MARKGSDNRPIPKDDPSRILQTTVEDVMHISMIPYAEHVILERALPRVEDGLKPVLMGIAAKKSVLEHRPVKLSEIEY